MPSRLAPLTRAAAAQHLITLLCAPDGAVVDAALAALAAQARRSASRGTRWHESFELGRARLPPMLQALARSHTVRRTPLHAPRCARSAPG